MADLAQRVEALEKRLAEYTASADQRVEALESFVGKGSPHVPCIDFGVHSGSPGGGGGTLAAANVEAPRSSDLKKAEVSHILDQSEVEDEAQRRRAHKLNPSVYEASLFIGLPVINFWGSLMASIGLTLNIGVQLVFCLIINLTFAEPQLPDPESILQWRITEGHLLTNMGTATQASLVSRVCHEDPTLIVSTDKQGLAGMISMYRKHEAGVILSIMVVFVWVLYAMKEIAQGLSFLHGICSQPSGMTRVDRKDEGAAIIRAVSLPRKIALGVLTTMRIALAALILFLGGEWLANTVEMMELVMNAAALAFILDLDEVFFQVCATFPTQVLVDELEPLSKKTKKYKGRHWHAACVPMLNLGVASMVVLAMTVTWIWPMKLQMEEIVHTLCGTPQDFVYTLHDSGIVFASGSTPFEEAALTNPLFDDVSKVIEAKSLSGAGMLTRLATPSLVQSFAKRNTADLTYEFTRGVMGRDCEDYVFGDGSLPKVLATLRRVLGRRSLTSCDDVTREECAGPQAFVRMACPETCGCSMPRSGLYRLGPERGCPLAHCQQKPEYVQALDAWQCQDPSPEELRSMAGWKWFWEQWSEVNSIILPHKAEQVRSIRNATWEDGCPGFLSMDQGEVQLLCFGSSIVGSVAEFCPDSCGCTTHAQTKCPTSCTSR